MMHSSEEVWALDDDCRGPVGHHTAHGPHTAGAILDCGPTGQYLLPWICYESYSATKTLMCSALLLPGVRPGSASNLYQPPIGKAELTPLYGPQL